MYDYWISSPGRLKWVKGSEGKGCVFCKIARGDKKIPAKVLYKNDRFMVIMNIFPYNTGHLQVMPVKHLSKVEGLSDKDLSDLFILVKKCMKLLKAAINPLGFNVGFNQGGDIAGASIQHIHIHIVPRFKRDIGFIDVIGKTKVLPVDIEQVFKDLKKHVDILK